VLCNSTGRVRNKIQHALILIRTSQPASDRIVIPTKKSTFSLFLNGMWRFFVAVHYNIDNVIKKGGGTRPVETLATL